MNSLHDLFMDELADMYDAEHRLVKALPKMAKNATQEELRQAFETHLRQTQEHVRKLEQVFTSFGEKAKGKKCAAMVGLLEEGEEIADENEGSPTLNAALISAAQKVEHYEIASYGTLREWAQLLDQQGAAQILQEILEEEKTTDELLTRLARTGSNVNAKNESASDEESDESGMTALGSNRAHGSRTTSTARAKNI